MVQRFEGLKEQLLRAGIAPRHVRRYIAELKDHFADLVREQTEAGSDNARAEFLADQRIGSDEELLQAVLKSPELRSLTSRYPWAVFGVAPVLMLLAGVAGAVLLEIALFYFRIASIISPVHPPWLQVAIELWNTAVMFGLPFGVAALFAWLGIRQRVPKYWIALSVALACVFGAGHDVFVRWSDLPHHSSLNVGFVGPGYTKAMVFARAIRAAINLGICAAAAAIWRPLWSLVKLNR